MDERTKQVLVGIIVAVIFIASVALIIIGQKNIGPQGLLTMLAGIQKDLLPSLQISTLFPRLWN